MFGEERVAQTEFQGSLAELIALCRALSIGNNHGAVYRVQSKDPETARGAQLFFYHPQLDQDEAIDVERQGRVTIGIAPGAPLRLLVFARPWTWNDIKPMWDTLQSEIDRFNAVAIGRAVLGGTVAPVAEQEHKQDGKPKRDSTLRRYRGIYETIGSHAAKMTDAELYTWLKKMHPPIARENSAKTIGRIVKLGRAGALRVETDP